MASWDPRTTYDVSEKELGLMKRRAEMRSQLKAYWVKEFNNPHTRVILDPSCPPLLSLWRLLSVSLRPFIYRQIQFIR